MDKVSNFKSQVGKLQLALKFKIVCGDVVQMLNLIIIIIIIIIKKKNSNPWVQPDSCGLSLIFFLTHHGGLGWKNSLTR